MHLRSLLVLLVVGLVVVGCHEIYPYNVKPKPDTGPADLARLDTGQQSDTENNQEDSGPPDTAQDTVATDTVSPDLVAPPDHGPYWDGGGKVCNNLLVATKKPIQVSVENDKVSGNAPSITAIGDKFYVAFIENKAVRVREIDATPPTSATAPKFSNKLSTTAKVEAPWITYNKKASRLALVWNERTALQPCSSNLYFRELAPTKTGFTLYSSCHLNPGSYAYHGYAPASLIHDGTKYALIAPVQYSSYQCNTHAKIRFHSFSKCTPLSGSAYNSNISPLLSTHYPVIAATGNTTSPYLFIRLYDVAKSSNPTTLDVRLNTVTTLNTFPPLTSFSGEQGKRDRPSLVASGDGVWLAWTNTSRQIKLHYRTSTTIKPSFVVGGYAMHPFLAHKVKVGTPASAKTVLAYTVTNASGSTKTAIKLAELDSVAPATGTTHTVAASSSTGTYSQWRPEETVVAAGTNGFGVAWTERIAAGQTEVFFQWVGCQP